MGCTQSAERGGQPPRTSTLQGSAGTPKPLAEGKPRDTHFALSDETYASLLLCWRTFRNTPNAPPTAKDAFAAPPAVRRGDGHQLEGGADSAVLTEDEFVKYAGRHANTARNGSVEGEEAARARFRRIVAAKKPPRDEQRGNYLSLPDYLRDIDQEEVDRMIRGATSEGAESRSKKKTEIGLSYIKSSLNADGADLLRAIQAVKANPKRTTFPVDTAIKIMCAFRDRQSAAARPLQQQDPSPLPSGVEKVFYGNPFDELALWDLDLLRTQLDEAQTAAKSAPTDDRSVAVSAPHG